MAMLDTCWSLLPDAYWDQHQGRGLLPGQIQKKESSCAAATAVSQGGEGPLSASPPRLQNWWFACGRKGTGSSEGQESLASECRKVSRAAEMRHSWLLSLSGGAHLGFRAVLTHSHHAAPSSHSFRVQLRSHQVSSVGVFEASLRKTPPEASRRSFCEEGAPRQKCQHHIETFRVKCSFVQLRASQ